MSNISCGKAIINKFNIQKNITLNKKLVLWNKETLNGLASAKHIAKMKYKKLLNTTIK